jgi:hypothetical protein
MHAGTDHATARTPGLGRGFDADPPLPESEDLSIGDAAVVGQIEEGGGSIGARGSRLDQGS